MKNNLLYDHDVEVNPFHLSNLDFLGKLALQLKSNRRTFRSFKHHIFAFFYYFHVKPGSSLGLKASMNDEIISL